MSPGSFGVAGVRPKGRRIHSGSLGSLWCALVDVGLNRGLSVHWGAPWGSSGSFGVFSEEPLGSSGSFVIFLGVVGFI